MTKRFRLPSLVAGTLLAVVVATSTLIIGSRQAGAHAVQVGSDPVANAQLARSPERITISFSEPIEPSVTTVKLYDQSAAEVPLGEVSFAGSEELTVQVTDELPSAIYTVVWRNLSTVDGHIWSGSFPFTVLGPGGQAPGGEAAQLGSVFEAPSTRPSTLDSASRWVVLLGSAVLVGGTAYVFFVAFPAARRLSPETGSTLRYLSRTVLLVTAAIGAFLVLEGSLLQVVHQADRLGGLDRVDNLLTETRSGRYMIARQALLLVGLLSIGMFWRVRGGIGQGLALGSLLLASVGVLLTQSLVSHAGASGGSFWTTGADFLHLLAAAFWIGALIHIGLAMPRWLDELKGPARTVFAADSFRRFSVVAAASVLVLMVSGVLSALAQFTTWSDLWSTSYGWSLVGKMGAMLPLLAIGGLNALYLQPRVVEAGLHLEGAATGQPGPAEPAVGRLQRTLVNTVRLEAVLGIAVLVAVAVLIQLEPPRAAAEAEAAGASVSAGVPDAAREQRGYFLKANQSGGLVVSLKVDPASVGENQFEVGLGSEFGGIGEVIDTTLEFRQEDADIGRSELPLALSGSARYSGEGSNLGLPGDWEVAVTVRRRGEDDVRTTFDVPVAAEGAGAGAAEAASDSIWDWPFEGRRSAGAIAALAVGGAGVLVVGAWQSRNLRRR